MIIMCMYNYDCTYLYVFQGLKITCLPVYEVRLDWLAAQLVEHLPCKQYVVGLNPNRAVLFHFPWKKRCSS